MPHPTNSNNKNTTLQLKTPPENRDEYFFKQFREQHPEPYYDFTNLPDSENLAFEMLSLDNHKEVPGMFEVENNPFVIEEYKDYKKFERYTNYHLGYSRYSPKYGGCDWLVKLKKTGEYIGILNVYDLSRETFNDHHLKCTIGFNTKEKFRRRGHTTEAVRQLLEFVPKQFGRNKILAYTAKDNTPSIAFLKQMGFTDKTEDYLPSEKYFFFEWTIGLFY